MSPLLRTSRYLSPKFKRLLILPSLLTNPLLKSSLFTISINNEPSLLGPPPIRVGFTESSGRGVFSTRRIGAGELIHTDNPVVSHPFLAKSDVVCYLCLRRLKPRSCSEHDHGEIEPFCSEECKEQSKAFYELEKSANWSVYHEYCRTQGLKYPLLVKRLACMVIAGAASTNCIDILQPAQILPEIKEEHSLLRSAFEATNTTNESLKYPNVHILWIDNVRARLKALCDIEEGEELRICYIDASMEFNARQNVLLEGFGFKCSCNRCLSGD